MDGNVLGRYPQTADGDVQPIEWLVLRRMDKKALLVSKYVLDARQFEENAANPSRCTWPNASLRMWLNTDFLNKAFTPRERAAIEKTLVVTPKSQRWDSPSVKDSIDAVFLLSTEEANTLLTSEARRCSPTPYAKAKGCMTWEEFLADKNNPSFSIWWLRSSGCYLNAAVCSSKGIVSPIGYIVYRNGLGVRPAMWVNTDSDIFNSESVYQEVFAATNTEHEISRSLDVKLTYNNGVVTAQIHDTESGLSTTIENVYSPDEHPEFDEAVGRELYSWLSLMADEATENK